MRHAKKHRVVTQAVHDNGGKICMQIYMLDVMGIIRSMSPPQNQITHYHLRRGHYPIAG